jgi:hypothetical protein
MHDMSRLAPLRQPYRSRYGEPVIDRVDRRIFELQYFTHCLQCGFCHDQCCEHGVDVDHWHYRQIMHHADALEHFTGIRRERWFEPDWEDDDEVPGGTTTRTRVRKGACVFLKREGRGCQIHAYCLERGLDYHDLKSVVDCLFPLTFGNGLLCPADEVVDRTLVCSGVGPTLYRGLRHELAYYFGEAFLQECDRLEEESR